MASGVEPMGGHIIVGTQHECLCWLQSSPVNDSLPSLG